MDFRYHGIGLLVALIPLTDPARAFCDQRWPYGAPNTCRNTEGGQLLGSDDFENALLAIADAGLLAIADAGLLAAHQPKGCGYQEMEAANRVAREQANRRYCRAHYEDGTAVHPARELVS